MNKGKLLFILLLFVGIMILLGLFLPQLPLNDFISPGVGILISSLMIIAAFFLRFGMGMSLKELVLVAILGAVSAVLRIPFAALPSIQPCTYLIICTGVVFGPLAGFMVGAMTPIVSNFFLGHGPWTIYQMLAWGLIGAGAPLLRRFGNSRIGLAVSGAIAGYFFGWIMNLWYVSIAVPTIQGYIAANIASLWFDTFHAIGNVVFLYLLGTRTVTLLERFKKRFRVYMPAKGMNEGLG